MMYFTFAIGTSPLPPGAIAERLLKSGIAETVTSPMTGEVRFSPRYRQLVSTIDEAEGLADVWNAWDAGNWKAYAKAHPLTASKLLLHELGLILRGRGGAAPSVGAPTVADDMTEVANQIKESVLERQLVSRLQTFRDWEMFRPAYLESEPYLRLSLRHTNFQVAIDGLDTEQEPQSAEILLLIHRSGTMLLTIPFRLSGVLDVSTLIRQSISQNVRLKWTETSEPVLVAAAQLAPRASFDGTWSDEVSEGVRWRHIDHDEDARLTDMFHLYRNAIEGAGQVVLEKEWHCHPTIRIGSIQCCGSEQKWRAHHAEEFLALTMKHEAVGNLRLDEARLVPETSVLKDASTWHRYGSTITINWDRERAPDFEQDLWTLALIDNFLLQLWQLRLLSSEVDAAGVDLRRLRVAQERIATGLEEYYQSALVFGTARETVERLLEESGATRTYHQLLERSGHLSSMLSAARAERTATRNVYVAASGVLLAGIFGFPAVTQTLKIASAIPPSSAAHRWATPFRWVDSFGSTGPWFAFMTMLGLLISGLIATAWRRPPRVRRQHRVVGFEWPHGQLPIRRTDHQTLTTSDSMRLFGSITRSDE